MRVSRTLPALAALLFVTACTGVADLVAPGNTAAHSTATGGGIGLLGSGNSVSGDSTVTTGAIAERGGLGLMGSGN